MLLISSCSKKPKVYELTLEELDKFFVEEVPLYTYKLIIEAKGETDCPISLYLSQKRTKLKIPYLLNGKTDTLFKRDWYGNGLGFEVEPLDCAGDVQVKFWFYHD